MQINKIAITYSARGYISIQKWYRSISRWHGAWIALGTTGASEHLFGAATIDTAAVHFVGSANCCNTLQNEWTVCATKSKNYY